MTKQEVIDYISNNAQFSYNPEIKKTSFILKIEQEVFMFSHSDYYALMKYSVPIIQKTLNI